MLTRLCTILIMICYLSQTSTTQAHKIKKSSLYLGLHFYIPTYFGSLKMNLNWENFHHSPVLSKSQKNSKTPKIVKNSSFIFKIDILLLLCILVTCIYLYLLNMILTSMKIHNPQILKKSSVRVLKAAKNVFHVTNAICSGICTFNVKKLFFKKVKSGRQVLKICILVRK